MIKMFSEGAESRVFEVGMLGRKVLVKVRHVKRYRIKQIDENLRRSRTKKEARAMYRAQNAGIKTAGLIGVGEFSIYMEKIPGKLLKDVMVGGSVYGRIGKSLAKMHNSNVVHGDFTPANIIVDESVPYIIDFGLADISNSIEDKAIDLLLMKRSITAKNYSILRIAYLKEYGDAKQILVRLADIEKRGRYQIRTLA